MITKAILQFERHPTMDRMWIAKVGYCSVITGWAANSGDPHLYELQDRKGNIHSHLNMARLLEKLNEEE